MADTTGIEWTDATWNPITGCTKVSPGCDHCYAETFAERWRGTPGHHFEQGFDLRLFPDRLTLPLRWRRPRRIFVNSMSDLFHDGVPDEFITDVFTAMARAEQHTFQILTKRPARMRALLSRRRRGFSYLGGWAKQWPLPNVWAGTSTEDQKWADIRIPALLDTPAAVRWISAEPLLGPIDLSAWTTWRDGSLRYSEPDAGIAGLDWVVVGGESGPGARPMHPAWARSLRDQCQASGVAYYMKQAGASLAKDWGCVSRTGNNPVEWPEYFPRDYPMAG